MSDMEKLYAQRLKRYVTAMRNEKPDRVPIRPFVAEFTAQYAGMTCQDVAHDYERAFTAARKCAADFEWDAVVGNMVYVWTGLAQTLGLKYYSVPGVDISADTGFQYLEPPVDQEFMAADEYDQLIEDPTGFLYNVWLPRVSGEVEAVGSPVTMRNNMALVKGGMAMWNYFMSFGTQNARLRSESGTVSAIAGILKAPFDIISDKLRGYLGILDDLRERPEKVLKACEALMPHLLKVALSGADPEKNVPVSIWMHRGCVPFVSPDVFNNIYWPTLRPIIEEIWAEGHQTLFYAEGDWNFHLDAFRQLPERSIILHADQADIFQMHKKLGDRFCLSGGVPNALLAFGKPQDVREHCRKIIEGVARDGGYIMDASAIVQNDAKVENMRALTEATLEYGVYDGTPYDLDLGVTGAEGFVPETRVTTPAGMKRAAGVCFPWEEKMAELPAFGPGTSNPSDKDLVQRVWQDTDFLGYLFIWHVLLSF